MLTEIKDSILITDIRKVFSVIKGNIEALNNNRKYSVGGG